MPFLKQTRVYRRWASLRTHKLSKFRLDEIAISCPSHNDNDDHESHEDDLFTDFDQRNKELNQQWNSFSFDDKEIYKKMVRAEEALYREVVSLSCI